MNREDLHDWNQNDPNIQNDKFEQNDQNAYHWVEFLCGNHANGRIVRFREAGTDAIRCPKRREAQRSTEEARKGFYDVSFHKRGKILNRRFINRMKGLYVSE